MTSNLDGRFSYEWLRQIALALLVGLVLGYAVGFSEYDAGLGFKYGSGVALIVFAVRRWKRNWTAFIVSILVLTTIVFLTIYSATPPASLTNALRAAPPELRRRLRMWEYGAQFHRLSYLLLALVGGILWTLVVVDTRRLRPYHRWLAVGSAIAFSIISTFDLGTKANQYRDGFRILNTAVIRYEADSTFTISQLADAYYEGESTIGDVKPNPR